jgi:hypothetical protein
VDSLYAKLKVGVALAEWYGEFLIVDPARDHGCSEIEDGLGNPFFILLSCGGEANAFRAPLPKS